MNVPKLKFALITAALIGMFGGTAEAEFSLAQQSVFTAEDLYVQMGGMPFEPSTPVINAQPAQRLAARS